MHLSEILAAQGITLQKTFVEKPRDHVEDVLAMVGERAELIAHVKDTSANLEPYQRHRAKGLRAAADMLEADAQDAFTVGLACPPKQQVAVPAGMALVPTEALLDIKNRVNTLATLSLKAERYSVGREIKQDIADMLAAAQGVKPNAPE